MVHRSEPQLSEKPMEELNGDDKKMDSQSEAIDMDVDSEGKPLTIASLPQTAQQADPKLPADQEQGQPQLNTVPTVNKNAQYLGDLPIDVLFEASKLPLDVAIYNSARAAGGQDKIRKYLQAVLVIGGSAAIPGMAHALESR